MTLFIMQFPPTCCQFYPLRAGFSKHLVSVHVLNSKVLNFLPRGMEIRLSQSSLKWYFCTFQYLSFMSNKILEFCIKNFLSSVVTHRGWCYSTLSSIFSPEAHDSFPLVSSCPITCYLSFLLARNIAGLPSLVSVSVHMILLQLPAQPT